jgi:hypothetical protein
MGGGGELLKLPLVQSRQNPEAILKTHVLFIHGDITNPFCRNVLKSEVINKGCELYFYKDFLLLSVNITVHNVRTITHAKLHIIIRIINIPFSV